MVSVTIWVEVVVVEVEEMGEVEDVEAAEKTTYLGLWDINCWYQVWRCDGNMLHDDKSSGGMILKIQKDVYKTSDNNNGPFMKFCSELGHGEHWFVTIRPKNVDQGGWLHRDANFRLKMEFKRDGEEFSFNIFKLL